MHRRHLVSIVISGAVVAFSGSLAAAVRSEMIVSPDWLAGKLDGQVIVVDVAERAAYQQGHIPGARLLEPKEFVITSEGLPHELPSVADLEAVFTRLGLGDSGRIVLYSRQPLLATRAWFTLDYLGHGHRASVLDGGYAKWTAEGRLTSTENPVFSARPFSTDPKETSVTTTTAMKELVRWRSNLADTVVIVDARPAHQYSGATPGTDVARSRGGHIPSAINIPWRFNVDGEDDAAAFKPANDLERLYARIDRDRTVVTYCRTGMEASMTYFVLRYLGFNPSLYDGSFIAWSESEAPVV